MDLSDEKQRNKFEKTSKLNPGMIPVIFSFYKGLTKYSYGLIASPEVTTARLISHLMKKGIGNFLGPYGGVFMFLFGKIVNMDTAIEKLFNVNVDNGNSGPVDIMLGTAAMFGN